MSPIVLAFIGDAVYSLYIREKFAFSSDLKSGELHKLAAANVNAVSQSAFITKLFPYLNEEETNIYKRARNTKKSTKAKNSSIADYNRSTGFEALIGFLYITANYDRLNYLLNLKDN
jgi:ribonuclease-3 family protein